MSDHDLPTEAALFWGDGGALEVGGLPDDASVDALDERGQPPIELGGGGLRRELEAMYAVIRADAAARLRWLGDPPVVDPPDHLPRPPLVG